MSEARYFTQEYIPDPPTVRHMLYELDRIGRKRKIVLEHWDNARVMRQLSHLQQVNPGKRYIMYSVEEDNG